MNPPAPTPRRRPPQRPSGRRPDPAMTAAVAAADASRRASRESVQEAYGLAVRSLAEAKRKRIPVMPSHEDCRQFLAAIKARLAEPEWRPLPAMQLDRLHSLAKPPSEFD